ncbi:MAG: nuclear transport factor 2 family protein [Acidithiobacillales bacterium]
MTDPARLSPDGFRALMADLAAAWNSGDARSAAVLFVEDAVYLEPTGRKFHRGRAVLQDLFERTSRKAPMRTTWRHIFFDEPSQTGAAEFEFAWNGRAFQGVAIVVLENGLVSRWREYQVESDGPFEPVAG